MFGPTPGSKSKAGQSFPRGTQMLFVQAAAPFGWTRVTTNDDALLRINGSTTPSTGGTNGFVAAFNSQAATGNFTLTSATTPAHQHGTPVRYYSPDTTNDGPFPVPNGTIAWGFQNVTNTDGGSGGAHNHSISTSIKYVDALVARKN
jgi:hypothetical protein